MTRQGRSPGHKPRTAAASPADSLSVPRVDGDAKVRAEAQAGALRYLQRTGNADVAQVLGLVPDPVAEQTRRNKALIDLGSKSWSACHICGNRPPRSGICRKTLRCRAEAARKELKELEEQ